MRYLLDTHTLLWCLGDDTALSPKARSVMADRSNDIFVSAASAWEVATKFAKGKLPSASLILPNFSEIVTDEGFHDLTLTSAHMVLSSTLL